MNIKQIKEDMVGTVIPRLEAKVTKVYERKTGEGQYGPWSLQSGTIEDSSGSMKILFKQLPSQDKLVGKSLIFKSIEGKRGLCGVECKQGKEYKNKSEIELHVSSAALIVSKEEEPNVSLVEPSVRMPMTATEAVQNERIMALDASLEKDNRKLGIGIAKSRMTQLAGLYDLCYKTVKAMDLYPDVNHKGELKVIGSIASCLFIQGVREGLADKMPVRTTSKFYNEDAIQPASATHRGEPESFDGDSGSNEEPF